MKYTIALVVALGCSEPPAVTTCEEPREETAAPSADPWDELATLDPRRPVPLLPMMAWHQKQNMQDHLVAISEITSGLVADDFAAVETAASRIGTSPQMQRMCEHMGAGAEGFTELALSFHREADTIAEAARTRDAAEVLRATDRTLRVCTSCHAAYRQELVDAATFAERTGSTPPTHGH